MAIVISVTGSLNYLTHIRNALPNMVTIGLSFLSGTHRRFGRKI